MKGKPGHAGGRWSDKIPKIASALGLKPKQVTDAVHKAKKTLGLRGVGGRRNPDVDINLGNGDIRIHGGNGEVEGNLHDYLNYAGRHQMDNRFNVNWSAVWCGVGIGIVFVLGTVTSPFAAATA